MNRQPYHLIYRWVRSMKVPVSFLYIKEKLLAHPDYPSLLSVTDILDELGIENAALVVDKEKLNEIPVPFLAHTTAKGGEFILVNDLKKLYKTHPDFEKQWNGVIVAAEKPEKWNDAENENWVAKEKRQKQFLWLTAASIIFLSTLSLWSQFSWQSLVLLITSLVGLGTAVLIVQHELGISNELTEQLCTTGKNTDCDAVMNSKGSKFLKWFTWADAGIIYFSSVFLLLTVSFFAGTVQSIITILSLLATCSLPFTVFSVYYQWRVVKKWCPLCLATVALVWIQFILLLPVTLSLAKDGFAGISVNEVLFTVFVFVTTTAAWLLLIKPALQKNKELTDKNFSLLRFKNNPDIFKTLLEQQRKVDTTLFENDLQLGNPEADLQIMVACNPYCGPCAKAHEILHELVEKNDIGLTIRFTVKTENIENKKLQIEKYMLQLLKGKASSYKRKALHDWFLLMDFDAFGKKYLSEESIDVGEQLRQHEQWTNENKIAFTPTIFINGYELPMRYKVEDLKRLPQGLIVRTEERGKTKQTNELILV